MNDSASRNGTGTAPAAECDVLPPTGNAYPIPRHVGLGLNRDVVMVGVGVGLCLAIMYLISKCKD